MVRRSHAFAQLYAFLTPFRMVNTSPSPDHVEDPAVLDEFLTEPPVKRIDLWFELGDTSVSASNFRGVTIKDALKAIHKRYKTKVNLNPAFRKAHMGKPSRS
jgi:hypothetical protein